MDKKIKKKKWTLKKIFGISATAIFITVILYNIFFGDHSSKFNVDKERITISTVKYEPFQEFIPITGTILPIKIFIGRIVPVIGINSWNGSYLTVEIVIRSLSTLNFEL